MRRSTLAIALVAAFSSGCLTADRFVVVTHEPIDPEVVGPIFPRLDGPPVECRGVPRDACLNGANLDEAVLGVPMDQVARIVLSCQVPLCDALDGDYRIDAVLRDGSTQSLGTGGYSSSP